MAVGKASTMFAATIAVVSLLPASFDYSLASLLFIPGVAAVMFLWFAGAYLLLTLSGAVALLGTAALDLNRGLFLLIGFFLPALLVTWTQWKGYGLSLTMALGILPVALAIGSAFHLFQELFRLITAGFAQVAARPEVVRMYSARDYEALLRYVDWMTNTVMTLFPALLLAFHSVLLFSGIVIGVYIIRRNNIFARGIRDVAFWKVSEWVLVPLGLAIIFVLTKAESLAFIGWNVLFLLSILYSICGLSFVEYQMRRRRFPLSVKVLVYLFLFLTQFVAAVVLPLLALFDSKFDFRRVRARQIG
jgi:hypothetical protein